MTISNLWSWNFWFQGIYKGIHTVIQVHFTENSCKLQKYVKMSAKWHNQNLQNVTTFLTLRIFWCSKKIKCVKPSRLSIIFMINSPKVILNSCITLICAAWWLFVQYTVKILSSCATAPLSSQKRATDAHEKAYISNCRLLTP